MTQIGKCKDHLFCLNTDVNEYYRLQRNIMFVCCNKQSYCVLISTCLLLYIRNAIKISYSSRKALIASLNSHTGPAQYNDSILFGRPRKLSESAPYNKNKIVITEELVRSFTTTPTDRRTFQCHSQTLQHTANNGELHVRICNSVHRRFSLEHDNTIG